MRLAYRHWWNYGTVKCWGRMSAAMAGKGREWLRLCSLGSFFLFVHALSRFPRLPSFTSVFSCCLFFWILPFCSRLFKHTIRVVSVLCAPTHIISEIDLYVFCCFASLSRWLAKTPTTPLRSNRHESAIRKKRNKRWAQGHGEKGRKGVIKKERKENNDESKNAAGNVEGECRYPPPRGLVFNRAAQSSAARLGQEAGTGQIKKNNYAPTCRNSCLSFRVSQSKLYSNAETFNIFL